MLKRAICILVVLVLSNSADGQCTTRYCYDEIDAEVSRSELWPLKQKLREHGDTIQTMQEKLADYEEKLTEYDNMFRRTVDAQDCADVLRQGHSTSGVYTIYLSRAKKLIPVYCDMETDGGGWLVFQRRQDGSGNFFRDWNTYKAGFGDMAAEFWLGNEYLHYVTTNKHYTLRIDMEDFENEKRYAVYSKFEVASEHLHYKLNLGSYEGTAGDSLRPCAYQSFSTKDRDYDSTNLEHCSTTYKGGWWYNQCHDANLNGLYLGGTHTSYADGIEWKAWHGFNYSLKKVDMKIRP